MSRSRITVVVPFYGYGRTDKKDQPARPDHRVLVADLIQTAGADRIVTLDLHAEQIEGFFSIAIDELPALNLFIKHFQAHPIPNVVVVAPDIGSLRSAAEIRRAARCAVRRREAALAGRRSHAALTLSAMWKGTTRSSWTMRSTLPARFALRNFVREQVR